MMRRASDPRADHRLGMNGAGTTTLMKLLLGMLRPTTGQVHLDGIPLADLPRRA